MASLSSRTRAILLAASLALVALATILLWPRQAPPPPAEVDLPEPPAIPSIEWPHAEDAPELTWTPGAPATLRWPDGMRFAPTPAPTSHYWDFSHLVIGPWHALDARSDNGDRATWWIAPGNPQAILELHVDLERGDWLLDLPQGALRAYPTDLLAATDDLSQIATTPVVGLTIKTATIPLTLTIQGPALAYVESEGNRRRLRLAPLPRHCESLASQPVDLRLTLTLGDVPVPVPRLAPEHARTQLIPIFVEPPNSGGDPWEEGRARTPLELARRIRALTFGHSDPEDPRYGNGGLLYQHIGASFAIPADWWEAPPITRLRNDLSDTPMEFILATDIPEDAPSTLPLRTDAPVECATIAERSFVLATPTTDAAPVNLGAWLPQMPQFRALPPQRDDILRTLVPQVGHTGGLRPGRLTIVEAPLVASRNPLVDSYQHTLLVPERQGHWTLHEDMIRALVGFEFREDRPELAITALATRARAQNSARTPILWQPGGSLTSTEALLLSPQTIAPASDEPLPTGPSPLRWQFAP
ncbi:hypothetical protein DL240_15955 [Lujinxingia litoralis]|uniref:Uncharacterized protein n=1 Tax=Lujinxingia litoralis TaxID=2211119 RepID=A0A328C5E7_9DELT|nr:hypothetical protein [Lujinxingia litoralis]RAL20533.1 hypothetical protein DL240_15955 [Lujinxingia litoralis]